MPRRHPYQRRRADPTITLINVVFLMLMFFLVAGTIAAPPPADLRLVQLAQADPVVPPDVLTMTAAGTVIWQGAPADLIRAEIAGGPMAAARAAATLLVRAFSLPDAEGAA